ncbi:MAG: hypothetical protein JWR39_2148, partial [Devosia sp.]|nr:hypothetical protein [Devosia sp.]
MTTHAPADRLAIYQRLEGRNRIV